MILVDSSVWVDHLRLGDRRLEQVLEEGLVLGHPWVTGELALGNLTRGQEILGLLTALPAAPVADSAELLGFVERHRLMGRGIGYVDVQLLAATKLASAQLWSRDKRLAATAAALGCAFSHDVGP